MRQRGRKSGVGLAVVVDVGRKMPAKPPPELTDAQAAVWRDCVASMEADWLTRAAFPILIEYCRHVCRARLLEAQIAAFEVEWTRIESGLERFDKMLAMAERETRAATACARALRLTPQALMQPPGAGRRVIPGGRLPMPWPASVGLAE